MKKSQKELFEEHCIKHNLSNNQIELIYCFLSAGSFFDQNGKLIETIESKNIIRIHLARAFKKYGTIESNLQFPTSFPEIDPVCFPKSISNPVIRQKNGSLTEENKEQLKRLVKALKAKAQELEENKTKTDNDFSEKTANNAIKKLKKL